MVGKSRGDHINRREEIAVMLDLGVRTIHSCGAAGLLILSGYWSPAAHHFRDIVECHQLFEFFRLHPERAGEWVAANGKERMRKFRFGLVQDILANEPDAKDIADVKFGFDFYSNAGSHPSIEGLSFHMTPNGKAIGPTVSEHYFRIFSADLWAYMTRATLRFVDAVDGLMPHHPKIADEFRYQVAVVKGGHQILMPIGADDLLPVWQATTTTATGVT
jgi:hypothetical protein